MTDERCPRCRRGEKVETSYTLGDTEFPDAYCGYCGRNWPPPKVAQPKPVVRVTASDDES